MMVVSVQEGRQEEKGMNSSFPCILFIQSNRLDDAIHTGEDNLLYSVQWFKCQAHPETH